MTYFDEHARARDAAVRLHGMLRELRGTPRDARDFHVFDRRDDWKDFGVGDEEIAAVDLTDNGALDEHIAQAGAVARALGHVDEDAAISGESANDVLYGGAGDDALMQGVISGKPAKWPDGSVSGTPYQAARRKLENRRSPPNLATMEIPYGVDIQANVAEAQKHRLDPLWFYNKVHNGGSWDYKAHTRRTAAANNGEIINPYEDFGNVHYGLVGRAAGFSPQVLLRMAGLNQETGDNAAPGFGHFYGGAPYGDDPRDGEAIRLGIDKYETQYRKP